MNDWKENGDGVKNKLQTDNTLKISDPGLGEPVLKVSQSEKAPSPPSESVSGLLPGNAYLAIKPARRSGWDFSGW